MSSKYIHDPKVHNTRAAEIIVPKILSKLPFSVKSVIDVGCGLGTWLKVFKDNNVEVIRGVDGDHLDRNLLTIPLEVLTTQDLEKPIKLNEKFDLAISLEVAEHLREESADTFVNSLVELSDVIIFSAALKNQGGQNHLNEQNPNYWMQKFSKFGYEFYDVFRYEFWDESNVEWWYRQNMFLVAKKGILNFKPVSNIPVFIHPELYEIVLNERNRLAKLSGYNYWLPIKNKIRSLFKVF